MDAYRNFTKEIYWIIKVSRYPSFWWCFGGPFFLGVVLAGLQYPIEIFSTLVAIFWFIVPASLFCNGINDAYDHDIDKKNPRKQGLEMVSATGEKKKLIALSWYSLASAFVIVPFLNMTALLLFIYWAAAMFLYNTPPWRFKEKPFLNVIFGAVSLIFPLSLLGYSFVSGHLPPVEFIVMGLVFAIACQITAGDVPDFKNDKEAGIVTTAIWLGSERAALLIGFILYSLVTVLLWHYGLIFGAFVSLCFPVYTAYEIIKNDSAARRIELFKNYRNIHIFFWLIVVTVYVTMAITL